MSTENESTNTEPGAPTSPFEALINLGAERLSELKVLADDLFEHMSPGDLGTILFPPALGLDLLTGLLSGGSDTDDRFDPEMPDADLMDACLNMARWFSEHYFTTQVHGVENVPSEGAALLVGNHSAGLMPMDALFAMNKIRDGHDETRVVHPLVHDFAYVAPKVARNAKRMGILRARKDNALAALAAGRLVLVYPGGDHDAFRKFSERGKIILAERKGFVRTALAAKVPIVPLVSVGLHESFIVISKGQRIAEKLGLKKLLRTDLFPVSLSFPWGLAPAFFPFLPLPTSIEMRFCEPITVEGDPGDTALVDDVYAKVEASMQAAMDEMSLDRIPLIGR